MDQISNSSAEYLTIEELRPICRLGPTAIRKKLKSGDFPQPHRLGYRSVFYARAEVEAWVRSKQQQDPTGARFPISAN